MSLINCEITDFTAQAYQQGDFKTVTKQDVLGKWSIFFFYPADLSFVCTTELEELQEYYSAFQKEGAEIYSISEDTEFSHMGWAQQSEKIGKIAYPMLADPTGKLARAFDVLNEEEGLAYRGVFVIDPEGKIQAYQVYGDGIARSAQEILRTLQATKFVAKYGDKVCPAGWKPGDEGLGTGTDLVGKL